MTGRFHGFVQKNRAALLGTSAAAAIAIAGSLVIPVHEGTVYKVYRDQIGVLTYCTGETRNPQPGRVYTPTECETLLAGRLVEFNAGIDRCITRPMTVGVRIAWLDTAYNIGTAGFCKSSMASLFNAGRARAACDALRKYAFAGGRWISGLALRREDVIEFCYAGIAQ